MAIMINCAYSQTTYELWDIDHMGYRCDIRILESSDPKEFSIHLYNTDCEHCDRLTIYFYDVVHSSVINMENASEFERSVTEDFYFTCPDSELLLRNSVEGKEKHYVIIGKYVVIHVITALEPEIIGERIAPMPPPPEDLRIIYK